MLTPHKTFAEERLIELGMCKEEARRFIAFIGMSDMLAFYLEYKDRTSRRPPGKGTGELLVYATRKSLLREIAGRALALTPSPNQVNPALQEKVSQLSQSILQLQSLSSEYEDNIKDLLVIQAKQDAAFASLVAAFSIFETKK